MKKFIVLVVLLVPTMAWAAKFFDDVRVTNSLGVGTASAPDSSAALEIRSTTKGLLLPRMTTAQRNSVGAPVEGLLIYNTDTDRIEIYTNTSFASTTTGISDPTVSTGDLLYRASSGAIVRLAIGSASQVLTVSGGIPQWVNASASSGLTDPMSTAGDIIIRNALNATARLGIGAASQVLTVSGGIPQWVSLPADVGFADPLTTNGDLIARIGGATVRLPIGTASQVLTVSGGIPQWVNAASGFADPMTTRGDVIYRDATNTTARLGLGTVSQALFSNGTDLVWANISYPADVGFADPMTTRGDVIYRNAANTTARLGLGTVSQALFSNGTDLVWANISYPADVGFADPLTTNGDLIARIGGATTRLGIGTASQILTVSGGIPQWVSLANAGGLSDPMTSAGDIIIRNAGNVTTRLAIGSASQVLTVSGGIPQWVTNTATDTGFLYDVSMQGTSYIPLTTTAVTTPSEVANGNLFITNASHALTAKIACTSGVVPTGTTCTGNESVGVNVDIPSDFTGNVEVCFSFSHLAIIPAGSGEARTFVDWRIIETESNAVTPLYASQGREEFFTDMEAEATEQQFNDVITTCGTFPVTGGQNKTYRLMYTKGNNTAITDSGPQTSGNVGIHAWVKSL